MTVTLSSTEQITHFQQLTDQHLKNFLKGYQNQPPEVLLEAIQYSIFAGGKRIRPVLVLMTAQTFNQSVDSFLPLASAIEILHTYSLIHDDLPAMDNDDLRRGQPTLHKKYDEAVAILAGDTMQAMAYECLSHLDSQTFTQDAILKTLQQFAKASGFRGMAGGQVLDIQHLHQKISLEELVAIHQLKTGALMQACVLGAAILAQATSEQLTQLKIFSESFGLIFQIKDDLLDIYGEESKLGKPIGSDQRNQKVTFPHLIGLEACEALIISEKEKANQALAHLKLNTQPLSDLLEYIIIREN